MAANFFQPGFDEQVEAQNIERQRQYAQMLRQQAEKPAESQMVSGHYVAPSITQHFAQLLKSYQVGKGMREADAKQKALAEAVRGRTTEEMGKFTSLLAGRPAEQLPPDQHGPAQPAQAPDMAAAYQFASQAQTPALQQVGLRGLAEMPQMEAKAAELAENRAFRISEREAIAAQRLAEMQQGHELRMQQMAEQNASRAQMAEEQRNFQMEMRRLQQSSQASAQPYFQPVQTANGVMAFNARTGRVEPVMAPDGKPIVGAAADPALQGAITGAETAARRSAESTAEARGDARKADMFLQQLTQAEQILKQGPTASGVGAAADAAGRLVGVSTQGAQKAGQLEALSGWLVANVPRMEGPQSNFDVQNYMTMAGKIGDRTTPVPERMAALQEVRRLQEKYKASAERRLGASPAPAPRTIRFDAQGNRLP